MTALRYHVRHSVRRTYAMPRHGGGAALALLVVVGSGVPHPAAAQPDAGRYRLDSMVVYASQPATDGDLTMAQARPSVWNAWIPSRGISISAQVITDVSHHRNALVRQGALQTRALSTVTARAALDSIVGWPGLTVVASGVSFAGADQTTTLGTANGGTSIDAPPFRALGEAWAEQRVAGGALRLKAGRLDANTEFAVAANARAFLRPGAGLDPTMATVMPTYPLPARGISAFVQLSPHVQLSGGLYDGRPAAQAVLGALSSVERRARFGIAELDIHGNEGRIAVGTWRHTSDFSSLLGEQPVGSARGLAGVYAVADRTLASSDEGEPTITAFAQFGLSDRRVSDVDRHTSVGVTATAPLFQLPAEQIGFAVSVLSVGEAGARLRNARIGARETHVEVFYAVQLVPWLTIAPNLHFIPQPVGHPERRDAAAFTVRFDIAR